MHDTPVPKHYDVFLSHNTADADAVELIARRLREEMKLEPFLDTWHLVPGEPWQEGLERALDASRACAVFLGSAGLGTWDNEAMRAALDIRAASPDFRVIPVLLPGATLPDRGRLPRFLARLTWVDFRTGLDDPQAFHTLMAGIQGVAPGPTDSADAVTVCPFRGLQVFDEEHAEFFFGREALTQYLVEDLRADRFLAVIGPSGSGKSSLARAGLLPRVRAGALPASADWPIVVLKPGPHPIETLAARLAPHLGTSADPLAARQSLLEALVRDERGLHGAVQVALGAAPDSRRLLLLVDQFEEIFTLCHDGDERRRFIANLLYAASIAGGQAVLVVTMRADFVGKCANYPDLAARLGRLALVGPMDDAELRRAMLLPAEKVGLHYERGLVETILDDLGNEPGELPLLQHTLLELWQRRSGAWLTTEAYHAIGGVKGALAKRADAIYDHLTPAQQAAARRVLLRLTQPGEGTEDTRRRATLAELQPAQQLASDVDTVVHDLADARLLITDKDERGAEIVDVAHEALIRGWPRLRAWIDADRAALRTHRRLTEAAEEWDANERDASYLYRGARLAEAQEWAVGRGDDLNELERAFLEASVAARAAERRATQRRVRRVIAGLAGALAVISLLAGTAVFFWNSAENDRQASELSRAKLLAELGNNLSSEAPLLGLRLALEGRAALPATAVDARRAIVATIVDLSKRGLLARVSADAAKVHRSPGGAVFVLDRKGAKGELRRTSDGARIAELRDKIKDGKVYFPENGDTFAVIYADDTSEVRRADSDTIIKSFKRVDRVTFSADGDAFVVTYTDLRGELYQMGAAQATDRFPPRSDNPPRIDKVIFVPQSPAFVVDYEPADDWPPGVKPPGELRWVGSSTVVTLTGEAHKAFFAPDQPNFVITYIDKPGELLQKADGAIMWQFAGEVDEAEFSADKTMLEVDYNNGPSVLYRLGDNGPITQTEGLDDSGVFFSPKGTAFVVKYADGSGELRWTDRDARVALQDGIKEVTFSPDGGSLVVDYERRDGELRWVDTSTVVTLAGDVEKVWFAPAGSAFVVNYRGKPGEVRDTSSAAFEPLADQVDDVVFSPDGTAFVVHYPDKSGELGEVWDARDMALLTTISVGKQDSLFAPDARRLVARYTDGRVYLFSLVWLRAMGGAPGRLPEHELVRLACTTLLTSDVWTPDDQAQLDEKLGGREAQACR